MPRYVTRDGTSLYYEWHPAAPERPVVVFLNGMGQCTRDWQQIKKLVAGEFSVLLFDARGQGRANAGREMPTLSGHSRDAAELLQHLRIEAACLAGVSHGGHVALALAGERPDLARAVAVCGLGAEYGPRVRLILSNWIQILQSRGINSWARAVLPLVFGEAFLRSREGGLKLIEAGLVQHNDSGALLRQMRALFHYPDPRGQAETVRCPVAVLHGDDDPLFGCGQAAELARICEGERRLFPGAGHTLPAEAPQDYVRCLREFFG